MQQQAVQGKRFGFRDPQVERHVVRIPGWSGRKRVVHLTDLHFGNVTPIALQQEAVAQANAAEPELVVLTGDFVCRGRRHLGRLTETLAAIKGHKVAVLGNHDYWLDGEAVASALRDADIEVIRNAWTVLGSGEDALPLVCMDDYGTGHHDVDASTSKLGSRAALALSHNPESAPMLWARGGPKVVLSGHTHGGQLHVKKWTPALWRSLLKAEYLSGFYNREGYQVYVNPGVGSSVVPWRYGRPAMRSVSILDLEGGPISGS